MISKKFLKLISIKTIYSLLIFQLTFSSTILLQAAPHNNSNSHELNGNVNLAEEGAFFVPEFNRTDLKLMTELSRGDIFGFHQIYPDPKSNPFFHVSHEFGPNLVTPAPSLKQFKENIEVFIDEKGDLEITESLRPENRGLGREHIFKSWKFKNVFLSNDYMFLEVDHSLLPKAFQGEGLSELNQSLVIVRLNDLINYMGTRKIVMSLMPLPSPLGEISSIEYGSLDEGKAKVDLALSKALGETFESGGYTIKDKSGRKTWVPEHLPDVYSDMSRHFIRGISASVAPLSILSEKLPPDVEAYMKSLEAFVKKQNNNLGGGFDKLIQSFLEKGDTKAVKELPFNTPLEYARSTFRADLTTPHKGNWIKKAYGTKSVSREEVEEAYKLVGKYKDQADEAKKVIDSTVKQIQNPHPTDQEIKNAEQQLNHIEELSEAIDNQEEGKIKKLMKNGLGNVVGLLGVAGLIYSFYTYTGFGGWTDNIIEGTKAMFSKDVAWDAIRVYAAIVFGFFGGILSGLVLYNKAYNKMTGHQRSFGMFLGSIGKKKAILTYLIPSKIIMNLIYPNYSEAMYFGAYPTQENGGRELRFKRSIRNINTFFNVLFSKTKITLKEAQNSEIQETMTETKNKDVVDSESMENKKEEELSKLKQAYINVKNYFMEKKDHLKELILDKVKNSQLFSWVGKGFTLFSKMPLVAKSFMVKSSKEAALKIKEAFLITRAYYKENQEEVLEKLEKEGRLSTLAKEAALFRMLPLVAKTLNMSEFQVISMLSFSPELFSGEKFVEPKFEFYAQMFENGQFKELQSEYDSYKKALSQAKERKMGLLLKYKLYRENKKLEDLIKNSDTFAKMNADFKTVYYLALNSIREEILASQSDIDLKRAQEIFEEALEQKRILESSTDKYEKEKVKLDLARAIEQHKKFYLDVDDFQKRGRRIRQYTELARIDEDSVKRIQRQVVKDFGMERVQSYAEFYKTLKEAGKTFYAQSWGAFFDADHTMGVYNQDARHALWNSWAWMISGPLGSANIVNRSARDAVDKGVEKYGFFYRNIRQFVNAKRYRQMNVFNKSMWFEYKRGFTRGLRSGVVWATFIHLTFYGQIRPDVYVTSLLMYGPLLFLWDYLESKLMHATSAIRFNKESHLESVKSDLLQKHNVSKYEDLPYSARMQFRVKKIFTINPQNYYQIFGLFAFNALTFFFERWSYHEGGFVKWASGGMAHLFNNPKLAFSLQDLKEGFVEPYFMELTVGGVLAFALYKGIKVIRKKMEAKRIVKTHERYKEYSVVKSRSGSFLMCRSLF